MANLIPTPKFASFFVYFSQVYGSIYSTTGVDFMDGAECVCSFPGRSVMDESTNERIARLLTQMSFFLSIMSGLENREGYYKAYFSYAYRNYYSLAVRLQKVVGWYAYLAILDTCNLLAPIDIGQDFS